MSERLTGEQLFLRYAWPCAHDGLAAGKISRRDFNELESSVKNGRHINVALLEKCFPNAAEALGAFAEAMSLSVWEFDTVAGYWRNYHGHSGDCAVSRVNVLSNFEPEKPVRVVSEDGDMFYAPNPYGLKLESGEEVFLHRRIIIEKA